MLQRPIFFLSALTFAVGLTACLTRETTAEPSSNGSPAQSASGAGDATMAEAVVLTQQSTNIPRLYQETCAKCHGDRGQGGGSGTNTLLKEEFLNQLYDRPYFDAIKNGVPDFGMEAYGETLTDPEIWGLVVYIREMQAQWYRGEKGSPRPGAGGVYTSTHHNYRIETYVEEGQGLATPWGIDWLPDGASLITNRPGKLMYRSRDGKLMEVSGVPRSVEMGQGGLMEVAVHPSYRQNGWVYLALNDPAPDGVGAMTKIIRGKLNVSASRAQWIATQTIFQTEPQDYVRSGVHFGSRIVFDGKGNIFFAIGERGNQDLAQNLDRPNGKIYRVGEDGSIPSDNPFASSGSKIRQAVWSYGHRNPQGLVLDLQGRLWDTEHGPRGGDELNLIEKGANYGWPTIAFSMNYNGSPHSVPWPGPNQDFKLPVYRWLPSIGACGLDVVDGKAFPEWNGDLVAGGLSGSNVDRIRIDAEGEMVEREELVHGMGRVRDVAVGPDGAIYVVLNQPDKIVRLVPAN